MESRKESRLLAEEVYGRSDRFASGDVECQNFDLGVAERHPGLDLAGDRRRRRRGIAGSCGVRGIQLQAKRPAFLDAAVGDEARMRLVGGVDGEDADSLGGGSRGVPTNHRVADRHRLSHAHQGIKHVRAPLDSVADDQLRLGVHSSPEPVQNADSVSQPRLSRHHHPRLQAEAHRACSFHTTHTNHNSWTAMHNS